jgi:hypothetical protein
VIRSRLIVGYVAVMPEIYTKGYMEKLDKIAENPARPFYLLALILAPSSFLNCRKICDSWDIEAVRSNCAYSSLICINT